MQNTIGGNWQFSIGDKFYVLFLKNVNKNYVFSTSLNIINPNLFDSKFMCME